MSSETLRGYEEVSDFSSINAVKIAVNSTLNANGDCAILVLDADGVIWGIGHNDDGVLGRKPVTGNTLPFIAPIADGNLDADNNNPEP